MKSGCSEGYWYKSHELWLDVQKADWNDVILHEDFKQAFREDIEGFFESEKVYREYSIPWKVRFPQRCSSGKLLGLITVLSSREALSCMARQVSPLSDESGEGLIKLSCKETGRQYL